MTVWRLEREASQTYEDALFDSRIQDTFNPFGTYAEARIDDFQGTKFDNYPYGTRIDLYFADEEQIDALLDVESGETLEITDTQQAQLLRNDGTVKIGPDPSTDILTVSGTHTINEGETETYQLVENDGTIKLDGTLQTGGVAKLQLGGGFENRFTGYVVERREGDNAGADELNLVMYTYDQFLRRNRVSSDQSGSTISDALESIITSDVDAVAYDASLVSVVDDQTLTQSYRGDKVENVLQSLSFKSGDEEFGVNSDGTFFFQPREESRAPRDIDNSQWFDYDIPEVGNEAINEVTVFYNDGDESVTVDAGDLKLDLEENLDLDGPGTQSAEITREDITELDDAISVGEQYLRFRNTTLTGQVMSYGLNSAEPGDVINIVIDERGIDDDFLIAENDMEWGIDQNALTVVEKRGDQDDILIRLNDAVDRREDQAKNRDGINNRVTSTDVNALIAVDADIDGTTESDSRFVNTARNLVRDAWAGGSTIDIATLVVGNDASGLSRTNTELGNQTNSASVSESLVGNKEVEYSASITQTGVTEAGLLDSNGDLICRVTCAETDVDGTITIGVTVSNDSSVSRGVVTNTGQTTIRDIIADNSPGFPEKYAYGSDGTNPTESDTSIGTSEFVQDLDNVLVQDADSQSQWGTLVNSLIADTDPLAVSNGVLTNLESSQVIEAETSLNFVAIEVSDAGGYSDDEALRFEVENDFLSLPFTTNYVYQADNVGIIIAREYDSFTGTVDYKIDGTTILQEIVSGGVTQPLSQFGNTGAGIDLNFDLDGEHTFTAELTSHSAGTYTVDVVGIVDRFTEFSNSGFSSFEAASASFAGPELYPDLVELELPEVITQRDVDQATVELGIDTTANEQFIAVKNTDAEGYLQADNTSSTTQSFASASRRLRTKLGIGRGDSGAEPTPRLGDIDTEVDVYELFANPQAINPDGIGLVLVVAVVPAGELTGTTIREGAELDTNNNALTRSVFPDYVVEANARVISNERVGFLNS